MMMGGMFGSADTLNGLSCANGEIAKWNGTAWACAADEAGMSSLPALTSARIWVGNSSNAATAVSTSGDATLSNAGVLTIASNAIGSDEITDGSVANTDLAGLIALSKLAITGTANSSVFLRGDGTWAAPPSGADNLGNHTATTTLNLADNRVDNMGRVSGGSWHATYDTWIQGGDISATGTERNLALLGNKSTDTLYLNYNGEYAGGTVIGGVITGNGSELTGLNASNLASGTVPDARLTGNYSGLGTVTATAFAGSGASLTNLNASNLASGTVATARLGSGTANNTTYLRGDGTWAALSGGSGGAGDYQTFTSSGTWVKPSGVDANQAVVVELWGGGGGGGSNASAGGGGGGAYSRFVLRAGDLGASVAVTIGAGGGVGVAGGTTSFGSHGSAYGGGFGTHNGYGGGGGGGGGMLGGGGNGSGNAGGSGGGPIGGPGSIALENAEERFNESVFGGGGGGGRGRTGNAINVMGGSSVYGGGGGGTNNPDRPAGNSVYGGGGGTGTSGIVGTSTFGGDGGASGVAGTAPAGGGGRNAAGARGEARIWVVP
jgi:hypothetical protein